MLKLDIEGAELEVLKDCDELLCNVNNLFVEYHSFINEPQSLDVLINILERQGFRIHIHNLMPNPQPFIKQSVYMDMDLQFNIFAYR